MLTCRSQIHPSPEGARSLQPVMNGQQSPGIVGYDDHDKDTGCRAGGTCWQSSAPGTAFRPSSRPTRAASSAEAGQEVQRSPWFGCHRH
jgi:hypothetical protein